ncbi:MAG: DUF2905 domain-containing protein [Halobacteriovoraceae bacterium]|nr:DUF2905 domain-containing protein [Halobacteriovoraceae bacterium]
MLPIAKILIVSGVLLIISGVIWHFSDGNIPLGRLPGDIKIEGQNSTIYIPITTCLIVSAVIGLVQYLIRMWK